jgi:hypothetical protein
MNAYHPHMTTLSRSLPRTAALLAAAALAQAAWGQATVNLSPPSTSGGGGDAVVSVPDPDSPAMRAYAATQKERVAAEKELRKIRAKHFGEMRNVEIRQAGLAKLRAYADRSLLYPSILEIFGREKDDVRQAIVDMLADQKTDEADTSLTWAAIFHKEPGFRTLASDRLAARLAAGAKVTPRIKTVVAEGLRPGSTNTELAAAATLAGRLDILDVVPLLINAQVVQTPQNQVVGGGGSNDTGEHALAYILIGTQQAYIADLQPVVGDAAVGFDPTIAVVTDGVVLRVIDATVITYHTEVHNALVDITSRALGQNTAPNGWDGDRWGKWYRQEWAPFIARKHAEERAAAEAARPRT